MGFPRSSRRRRPTVKICVRPLHCRFVGGFGVGFHDRRRFGYFQSPVASIDSSTREVWKSKSLCELCQQPDRGVSSQSVLLPSRPSLCIVSIWPGLPVSTVGKSSIGCGQTRKTLGIVRFTSYCVSCVGSQNGIAREMQRIGGRYGI